MATHYENLDRILAGIGIGTLCAIWFFIGFNQGRIKELGVCQGHLEAVAETVVEHLDRRIDEKRDKQ